MTIIQVKSITVNGASTVNLPTWQFIKEIGPGIWEISVPDDETTNGKIDKEKIRYKYRRSRWDRPDIGDDI